MLDVIHYILEQDTYHFSVKEERDFKEKTRKVIYREIYNKDTFDWVSNNGNMLYEEETKNITPFDPETPSETKPKKSEKPKPYIKPSNFNPDSSSPFGSKIDSPLN